MFTIFQRRISKLSTSAEVNFSKLVRAVYVIFPSSKWKPPWLKSPPNKLGPDSFVLFVSACPSSRRTFMANAEMLPRRCLTKFLVTKTGLRMSFIYLVVFELCQYHCDHHPLLLVSIDLKGLINDHCFLCQKIVTIGPIGTSTTNKQEMENWNLIENKNYKTPPITILQN